jgi:hypothetical protein
MNTGEFRYKELVVVFAVILLAAFLVTTDCARQVGLCLQYLALGA